MRLTVDQELDAEIAILRIVAPSANYISIGAA
jgi:hypothetical protein